MSDDVVDIRKRIEEIRSEVSTAMASNRAAVIGSRPAGEIAEFSIPGVTTPMKEEKPDPLNTVKVNPATLPDTQAGLDAAMALPSFQLNVRNQNNNRLLHGILLVQLLTNICLIAVIWFKLG